MSPKPLICIVDDDEAVRDSLQFLLTGAGFRVKPFESGSTFLDGFKANETGCVLLDIRLGDIDGLEVLERIAEKGVSVPVVMITGNADVSTAVRAMKAGAADFIEKPYSDELIFSTIRRVCDAAERARHNCPPGDPIWTRIAALTPRERDVLEHMVIGRPNKITAYELGISPRTVEIHRRRVMQKMQADSFSHLVRMALQAGLLAEIDEE